MRKRIPSIIMVEWIEGNEARVSFSSGKVIELHLPVKDARKVKIVDEGSGLDPGDGLDMGADTVAEIRGKIYDRGEPGWVGYVPLRKKRRRK